MTRTAPPTGTAPLVAVRDVQASVAFYITCLGFEPVFPASDSYALMRRGDLMVGFVKASDDAALTATATNASAQMWMADVAAYYEDVKGRFGDHPDLRPTAPILRDYGVRELHIKDPDGFLMFFTDTNILAEGAG